MRFCESVNVMPSQPARSARFGLGYDGAGLRHPHGPQLHGARPRDDYSLTISLVCNTGAMSV